MLCRMPAHGMRVRATPDKNIGTFRRHRGKRKGGFETRSYHS